MQIVSVLFGRNVEMYLFSRSLIFCEFGALRSCRLFLARRKIDIKWAKVNKEKKEEE
jgi:hypothetical protein